VKPREMNSADTIVAPSENGASEISRRSFFKRTAAMGAADVIATAGLTTVHQH